MLIELDDVAEPALSPEEMWLEFAIWLYQTGKLSKVQARRLARRERIDFDLRLAERGLGTELTEEEYRQDLEALARARS